MSITPIENSGLLDAAISNGEVELRVGLKDSLNIDLPHAALRDTIGLFSALYPKWSQPVFIGGQSMPGEVGASYSLEFVADDDKTGENKKRMTITIKTITATKSSREITYEIIHQDNERELANLPLKVSLEASVAILPAVTKDTYILISYDGAPHKQVEVEKKKGIWGKISGSNNKSVMKSIIYTTDETTAQGQRLADYILDYVSNHDDSIVVQAANVGDPKLLDVEKTSIAGTEVSEQGKSRIRLEFKDTFDIDNHFSAIRDTIGFISSLFPNWSVPELIEGKALPNEVGAAYRLRFNGKSDEGEKTMTVKIRMILDEPFLKTVIYKVIQEENGTNLKTTLQASVQVIPAAAKQVWMVVHSNHKALFGDEKSQKKGIWKKMKDVGSKDIWHSSEAFLLEAKSVSCYIQDFVSTAATPVIAEGSPALDATDEVPVAMPTAVDDVAEARDETNKLQQLLDVGAISQEEYETMKGKIQI